MDAQPEGPIPLEVPVHSGVRVTRLLVHDLPDVATLHARVLPPSFFASLGPRFLRRYHESFLASPHGIGLAATQQQQLCGFITGSSAAVEHSAWVVRHRGVRLAAAALVAMLLRPRVLLHFLASRMSRYARGLHRRLRHRSSPVTAGSGPARQPAVLAHVAVHSAWQRMGLGEVLVRAFEREVASHGGRVVELVTLDGAQGAAAFYERLGYSSDRVREDDEGRRWVYLRKTLQPG